MSFKDLALPLAAKGIPVIWVKPFGKESYLPGGEDRGTLDPEKILQWDRENPDYNVGCLGTSQGIVVLDCDVPGLMTRIEKETGRKFPETFIVKSGKKGCAHLYFRQTDVSRRLENKGADGLFDLRGKNQFVVGPGSKLRLDDGSIGEYRIWRDAPIADFPDWLAEWVIKNSSRHGAGVEGEIDGDSYRRLREAYTQNLNPEELFGLGLTIQSLHPTLYSLACLLHDGQRNQDEILGLLQRLAEEYGHRGARAEELEDIVEHALEKEPCELTLEEGHPELAGFSEGLRIFGTAGELEEYQKALRQANVKTSNWFFPVSGFIAEKLPPRKALVSHNNGTPLLFEQSINQIFAFRGQGKTMFKDGLVDILTNGGEFLQYRSTGGYKVLNADGELPAIQLQERFKKLIRNPENMWFMSPERLPGHVFPRLSDPEWQEEFLKRLEQANFDVIVFDTLTACFRFDTNDPDIWLQVNQFLITLRIKGYCVIIVHHAGKSGTQRGRTDGDDNLDLSIKLDAPKGWAPGDGLEMVVSYEKVRAGGNLPGFQARFNDEAGVWEVMADEDENLTFTMLMEGRSVRAIATALDISTSKVWRLKRQEEKKGRRFPSPQHSGGRRKTGDLEDE